MSIDVLEKAVNEVTDKDWNWWPFLWLRPEKHARLSLSRLVSVAILYGLPCGALASIAAAMLQPHARASAPLFVVAVPTLFLFIGSVVVGPMWNRRAERLRARGD